MRKYYFYIDHVKPILKHINTMLHIGDDIPGLYFKLHIYPELGINSLAEWEWLMKSKVMARIVVKDCSGNNKRSSHYEVLNSIKHRAKSKRNQIGGQCVGHGSGTWDYFIGTM